MDHHWRARAGSVWLVLWPGGRVLLGGATRRAMFERFTDRARRVVVLAQDEARRLDHYYIGTEHLLLGLIDEGTGVAIEFGPLLKTCTRTDRMATHRPSL